MAVHFPKTNFTPITLIPTPRDLPEIKQQRPSSPDLATLGASLDKSFMERARSGVFLESQRQIPTPKYSPEIEQQLSSMRNISRPQNGADLAASIRESTDRTLRSMIADLKSQRQSLAVDRHFPLSPASQATVPPVTVSQAERIGVVVALIIPIWVVTTGIVECFACRFTVVSRFKTAISISGTTALAILTYANPPMGFVAYGITFVGFLLVAGILGFPYSLKDFRDDDYPKLTKYNYKLDQQLAQIAYENLSPRPVLPPTGRNFISPLYSRAAQRPHIPYVPYIFVRDTTEALDKPPIPKAAGGKNHK